MPRVLVIGSANVDFTMALARLPRPGETVTNGTLLVDRGGKGANQAVAARRLGADVRLIACVGDDASGREVRAALDAEGIGTAGIVTSAAAATGTALILVDREGRNQIAVAPGANRALTPEHVRARADDIAWAEVVLASCEVPLETVRAGLELARRHGALTILNPAPVPDAADDRSPEPFDTPGVRTIEELMRFTGIGAAYFIKTLAYVVEGQLVLALLRGDHELNETKFADALGGRPFRPAHPDEIRQQLGAQAGFIGPVGVRGVRLLADEALRGRRNLITGANQDDRHLRNVTPDRDFQAEYADLRTVRTGEGCPACEGELIVSKAIEIGHIFKLGRRYAEALGARVLDAQGREVTLIMGSYGIGVERILTAAIEQNHDADGMFLPVSIAPFQVLLTPTNLNETPIREVAERLYAELQAAGIEVLYDDRDERPGVKFKDADLIGIPYRITVGRKVQDGNVELLTRSTRSSRDASISQVVPELRKLLG